MKKLFLLIIIILGSFLFKIPKYVELNNLAIIESIAVEFTSDKYTIYLKEIIPKKDENGIKYEYKYYKQTDASLKDAYKKLDDKTKKKFYFTKVKSLITNLEKSDEIIEIFAIKPKNIIHVNKNIFKKLKND